MRPESPTRNPSSLVLVLLALLTVELVWVSGFQLNNGAARPLLIRTSTTCRRLSEDQGSDFERPGTFLDNEDDGGINIVFIDEEDDIDDDVNEKPSKGKGRDRWENLKPSVKKRIVQKGQEKAIANKKKREPASEKKRRMMMKFKELQRQKKQDSRVKRPLGFDERAPLTAFFPGMEVTGTVISLTNYGAYVDVGTECDGLLHVSQMTRKFFVEHPRQVVSPGDEIIVKVRSASPELKKMQLTMLDAKEVDEDNSFGNNDDDDEEDRTSLTEFELDDELWGELKRVTDFGAYVEVGAEVDAFLHFMDHPLWEDGKIPSEFMEQGQRVRVWVDNLDMEKKRIRVTACRPENLPGPRIEF
jgi:predicted RNA-binding protein with RPS1 domain